MNTFGKLCIGDKFTHLGEFYTKYDDMYATLDENGVEYPFDSEDAAFLYT